MLLFLLDSNAFYLQDVKNEYIDRAKNQTLNPPAANLMEVLGPSTTAQGEKNFQSAPVENRKKPNVNLIQKFLHLHKFNTIGAQTEIWI